MLDEFLEKPEIMKSTILAPKYWGQKFAIVLLDQKVVQCLEKQECYKLDLGDVLM